MLLSIYFLSIIFFIIGWIYYSKPERIQRINTFLRNKVFNDRYTLIKRKKIAVLFFVIACLLASIAFIRSIEENKKTVLPMDEINKTIYYDALYLYKKTLEKDPENVLFLTKSACIYEALNDKKKADSIWKKILILEPNNDFARMRLNDKY